ncbi:MAG: histidine kinase, partial [Clostridiales bacterium]|nr:histidine kinase [Clostridiales bacterium]
MAGRYRQIKWMRSIQTKQLLGFALIVALTMLLTYMLQTRAIAIATETTYEKMDANAHFWLSALENEISHVHDLQMDFFNDRKLTFLVSPYVDTTDYERREYLLSVRERIMTITGVSDLVADGILFLPKTGYKITQSGISRMQDHDYDAAQACMKRNNSGFGYDRGEFCLVETGAPRIQSGHAPNHILAIAFSPEMIRRRMATLNTSEGSGAFIFLEEESLLLESARGEAVGADIYRALERNGSGKPLSVQRLMAGGDWYLVFVGGESSLGLFAQYVKEAPIMRSIYRFRAQMLLVIGLMAVMAAFFAAYTRRLVHKPINDLLEAFSEIKGGNWAKRVRHAGGDEFSRLYEGFNDMAENTERLIDEVYVQTNLAQRAQLKHLQAQINPHFLYNSFFTLSRRVKRRDCEGVQELAEHLGNYFQFLARDASDAIALGQEIEHAKSYAAIQGTRFASRLAIRFDDLPEGRRSLTVPRLILQPLLENAFEHGLENTIKDGLLQVSCQEDGGALLIHVEDNGKG